MPLAKYKSYVICTSPRSGSTLLCKLLAATGVAGNPDSYFHRPSISDWLADLGLAHDPSASDREVLQAVFRAAISKGTLGAGVFGLRLQRHSFDLFAEILAVLYPRRPNDITRFQAAFGRTLFVHLTRRDKVAQAVSYVKARQTGLWHARPDGTELERLSPPRNPLYDAREIRTCLDEMIAHDDKWEHWFAASGIDPLRITYEGLSADPTMTLRAILARLELETEAAENVDPAVAKLADDTNRDWAARFRSEQKIT
jgi:trehalose 2-sulfotransferase